MRRGTRIILAFIFSIFLSRGVIHYVAYPILLQYPRFAHVMARFPYTKDILTGFLVFTIWALYLQWEFKYVSNIYLYLVFSVYLFLLFVVLFTKAEKYHNFDWKLFGFLVCDKRVLTEALLNIVYFIPLGIIYAFRVNWWEFIIITLLTLFGIETIQYVFYVGTFSVSDILLNSTGCSVGYVGYRTLKTVYNDHSRKHLRSQK